MTAEKYDELVAAIVKAVPEIYETARGPICHSHTSCAFHCHGRPIIAVNRPITLEDVLRALGENYAVGGDGRIREWNGAGDGWTLKERYYKWHLGHDLAWHRDNAHQTIFFLHGLLTPES